MNQKDKKKKIKKKLKKINIQIKTGTGWTEGQMELTQIPKDEIQKCNSSWINPDSELMQNHKLMHQQAKLFENILDEADIEMQKKMNSKGKNSFLQALPIIKRESNTYHYTGIVQGSTNVLYDETKIKKKIMIPTNEGFNFAGLIIGPKGANQKRLEERTGCKILVRGRGSQKEGQKAEKDDWEPLHVLIAADTQQQIDLASNYIHKILNCDEKTRNILRNEQLREVARLKNDQYGTKVYENVWDNFNYLGLANPNAYIIPIPNKSVSTILGCGGQTLINIKTKSEAHNIHLAPDSEPGTHFKKLYIEGNKDAFLKVKKMVDELLDNENKAQKLGLENLDMNQIIQIYLEIPIQSLPHVIGQGQQILQELNKEFQVEIKMSQEQDLDKETRIIELQGLSLNVNKAKRKIDQILENQNQNWSSIIVQKQKQKQDMVVRNFQREMAKDTNYYMELKNYFKLGLDFLDNDNEMNKIEVTDYYDDGIINRYYIKNYKEIKNKQFYQKIFILLIFKYIIS